MAHYKRVRDAKGRSFAGVSIPIVGAVSSLGASQRNKRRAEPPQQEHVEWRLRLARLVVATNGTWQVHQTGTNGGEHFLAFDKKSYLSQIAVIM